MKRLDLVFFRGAYNEMQNKIDRANKELLEFTHENKDLEPIRRRRRSRCPQESFRLIMKHATSLYNVFVTGRAWSCRCMKHHTASLRLEPRPRRLEIAGAAMAQQPTFRVRLSTPVIPFQSQNGKRERLCYEWREVEVQPFETESGADEKPRSLESSASSNGSKTSR